MQTLFTHEALQLKGQVEVEQLAVTQDVPVQFLMVQFPKPHWRDWEHVLHSVFVQLLPEQFVLLQLAVQFVLVVTQ